MDIESLIPHHPVPDAGADWRAWLAHHGYGWWHAEVLQVGDVCMTFELYRHADRFCLYAPSIPGTGVPAALYLHGTRAVILEQLAAEQDVAAEGLRRLQAART